MATTATVNGKATERGVVESMRVLMQAGQVCEVRAIDARTQGYRRPHVESGYFDNPEAVAKAVKGLHAKGIYFTPNPVNRALLARASNRIRPADKEPTTGDADVDRRAWLLVDVDPRRAAGISSTESEHAAALAKCEEIAEHLSGEGWPEPVKADSGNGAHLMYAIDLPADDGGLVERCLKALAGRFDDDVCTIDQKVFNPARIWRLYGTMARKGDSTEDRPHRQSCILSAPAERVVVSRELLEQLAAEARPEQDAPPAHETNGTARAHAPGGHKFDLAAWIQRHGLDVKPARDWSSKGGMGRKWIFNACPFIPEHTDNSAYVGQRGDGAIVAGCQHQSCNWGWADLRERFEPGYRDRKERGATASGVTNAALVKTEDGDKTAPLPMTDVLGRIKRACDDWPRRVDNVLFVHDATGVCWLNSPAAVFGWLSSKTGVIHWKRGSGAVTKEEVYQELRRVSRKYAAVEEQPHEPPIDGHYYACSIPEPGNGDRLRELVAFFAPETDIDADLITAAFATPYWGGPAGLRPCFVITSNDGRGVGKSKVAAKIARLAGGAMEFSSQDSIADIKSRMLSPEAITNRIAILDNVKSHRFSWGELEGLVTAPAISGKRMYVGDGSRPNTITWFITLNGASLSTDMAQRSVIVKVKRPKRSATWEERLDNFIDHHRAEIIADIVGLLRSPPVGLRQFSRWATWESRVLARLPDPSEAQAVIAERQGDADVEEEESETLREFFDKQLRDLDYDTEHYDVHIPTAIAARWFNWATGQREKTIAVGRILKQMAEERPGGWLKVNASRTYGRGFVWSARCSDPDSPILSDLEQRLAKSMEERARTGKKEGQANGAGEM